MDSATFNADYWAHQPSLVQELRSMQDQGMREAIGIRLATEGYEIDVPIMVWGWDPLKVMQMRQDFGFTWVPSALMPPVLVGPGLTVPGGVPYDPKNPPPGAIIVSTNLADYPPYNPPPAPPQPVNPPPSLIGKDMSAGFFQALGNTQADGTVLKNGDPYTDPNGTGKYVYHESHVWSDAAHIVRWFEKA